MKIKTYEEFKQWVDKQNWKEYKRMRDYDRWRQYEVMKMKLTQMASMDYELSVRYICERLKI